MFPAIIFGQSLRGLINDGVDAYDKESYADAEINFRKGLDKEFESFEGHFNLGDALYKQQKYDEALEAYKNALSLAQNDYQKSKVFHNVGNTLLKQQKLKESIGAYANSLKINPEDLETKYNLSYALNMLQNQQQQQQNQDQNQDQNQENQDQQNQDQQNQDQQNQDKQNQDQKENQDQKQNQQQQQTPREEISKEEAERILEALKQNEGDLQKELRKKKGQSTKRAKDW
jgi:tetratricopeptide (TPR) repeat protein